jgi:hypothetical protein
MLSYQEMPSLSAPMRHLASHFSTRQIISIAMATLNSRTPGVLEAYLNE